MSTKYLFIVICRLCLSTNCVTRCQHFNLIRFTGSHCSVLGGVCLCHMCMCVQRVCACVVCTCVSEHRAFMSPLCVLSTEHCRASTLAGRREVVAMVIAQA